MKWSNIVVSPAAPQAGDTVFINGTVTSPIAIKNGTGLIDAYLYGADVFEQPINTCGETLINVLGVAQGVLDALACPVKQGGVSRFGFAMAIPDEASGLGQLNITVTGNDGAGVNAFCIDLVVTL